MEFRNDEIMNNRTKILVYLDNSKKSFYKDFLRRLEILGISSFEIIINTVYNGQYPDLSLIEDKNPNIIIDMHGSDLTKKLDNYKENRFIFDETIINKLNSDTAFGEFFGKLKMQDFENKSIKLKSKNDN